MLYTRNMRWNSKYLRLDYHQSYNRHFKANEYFGPLRKLIFTVATFTRERSYQIKAV